MANIQQLAVNLQQIWCAMQVQYLVLGIGLFIIFVLSAAGEIALVWVGLLGEPLLTQRCAAAGVQSTNT